MKTVLLDAGHGGKDYGAVGNGIKEKDRALDYTLEVGKELTRHNVKIVYSRKEDVFIELNRRSKLSNNNNADIFVSIHLNSFTNAQAQGFEIFHYPSSIGGKELATNIHSEVINNGLYTKDRGIKTANFAVIGKSTNAPATLIELGFISNLQDVALIAHKQSKLVQAITKGILKTLNIKYIQKEVINVNDPSEWAKEVWNDAIEKGYTDGTRPKEQITREETMAMIYKVLNK